MIRSPGSVHPAARGVLEETDVAAKLLGAETLWASWLAGELEPLPWPDPEPLVEAGRPARPELAPPQAMPRRELSQPGGHAALIHALAHIEFTAINLALDAVYRFQGLPREYYGDWLEVAAEEARHFRLLAGHLRGLGGDYGDFPAHEGLWDLARKTAHDPLARMALVPRLMEARGLDATPAIRRKLAGFGDAAGAAILDVILADEVGHVAAGDRWFRWLCAGRGLEPEQAYLDLLAGGDAPKPRAPFNEAARLAAGFGREELRRLEAAFSPAGTSRSGPAARAAPAAPGARSGRPGS